MKKLAQNIVSVRMRHPGWHLHHCSVFSFIFQGQTTPVMQSCMNCRFLHAGGRMRLYTFPRAAGAENARRIRRFVRNLRTFHNFLRFSPPGGASPSPAASNSMRRRIGRACSPASTLPWRRCEDTPCRNSSPSSPPTRRACARIWPIDLCGPPCYTMRVFFRRTVAQPGSAFAWGAKGLGFKSRRSDHSSPPWRAEILCIPDCAACRPGTFRSRRRECRCSR